MSIKPIDFQMLIPKTPEIHKTKQLEIDNEKNNAHIINQKNIENQNKALKQVNKSDKLYKSRISKEDQQKNSKEHDNNSSKKNKKKDKGKKELINSIERSSKIDIRI